MLTIYSCWRTDGFIPLRVLVDRMKHESGKSSPYVNISFGVANTAQPKLVDVVYTRDENSRPVIKEINS